MTWLEIVSWISIILGFLQAIIITFDVIKYPQKMMPIMNIVWPLTGLYFPIIGIWAYYTLGRATGMDAQLNHHHMGHDHMSHMDMEAGMDMAMDHKKHSHDHSHHQDHNHMNHDHMSHHHEHEHHEHGHNKKPFWQSVFVSSTHCSSGCSLGDMIGAPLVFFTGLTIAGVTLFADYAVEFILAYIFGIAFQYYGMGKPDNPGQAFKDAIKADTLSLIAFEIGMFGWMALVNYVFFIANVPEPNTPVFWFMMQLAMMLGFATSYPANWFLVKKGIKHAM